MSKRLSHYFKSLMLGELLQGMALTMRYFVKSKYTMQYRKEDPQIQPFPWPACAAPLRQWRGALHCLQAVRGGVPGAGITIDSDMREDGSRRTTRYDIDLFKCIYCGFCEESCPVDSIVETDIHEYHFENRGEHIVNKQQLLAIGDRYEEHIAAARAGCALPLRIWP